MLEDKLIGSDDAFADHIAGHIDAGADEATAEDATEGQVVIAVEVNAGPELTGFPVHRVP